MKSKEFLIWFLTALFGVLIVICSAFLMTALAVTLPEEKNIGSVETQNISSEENCPETMNGQVTIYHDGEKSISIRRTIRGKMSEWEV